MSKPKLAYWDIRGLAQPIRHMLVYLDIDFEDIYYVCGDGPTYDRSSWLDVKYTLGLEYPNLPYYIEGDLKLTQSKAIFNHISRKNGLDGKTEEEKCRIDLLDGIISDISTSFTRMCYFDYDGLKPGFDKALPNHLKSFSDSLGAKKWCVGEEITQVDFNMYELLLKLSKYSVDCMKDFQNLKDYISRFEAIPNIAKYMQKPNYIHRPFNNKMAKFL